MKKHPIWLCIILVLLAAGCGKIHRLSENEVVPVSAVEMLHQESEYKQTFSLRLSRQLRLRAVDEKGKPLKGETFLFSINPAAEPFTTAATDAKGKIKVTAELPTSVKEIYVRPHSTLKGGEQLMKVTGSDEFVYTSVQKEFHPNKKLESSEAVVAESERVIHKIKPDTVRLGTDEVYPTDYFFGTLAFEDLWPEKGDYDFNDVVIQYEYGLEVNSRGVVTGIRLVFIPVAVGALSPNGFGIQLPVRTADCTSDFLEEGNTLATIILTNDVHSAFKRGGFINTEKDAPRYSGTTYIVNLKMSPSVQIHRKRLRFSDFNPFIFVRNRAHEIHLPDKVPTEKVNRTLFGTKNDRSIPEERLYYRMDNHYPWALDIPRKEADSPAWRYPYERVPVTKAYPNYLNWTQDWYEDTVPGNVNKEWVVE